MLERGERIEANASRGIGSVDRSVNQRAHILHIGYCWSTGLLAEI